MEGHESKYAVCPYFRRMQQNRICCEGVSKRNTINLVFEDTYGNVRYRQNYCNNLANYKKCHVCRMLDRKYEEEDV